MDPTRLVLLLMVVAMIASLTAAVVTRNVVAGLPGLALIPLALVLFRRGRR
ncbi:MAG TPA: hypothetical protein VF699_09055 [Caulobacteraceae bacterium]|jgi:hypothetical protein